MKNDLFVYHRLLGCGRLASCVHRTSSVMFSQLIYLVEFKGLRMQHFSSPEVPEIWGGHHCSTQEPQVLQEAICFGLT